MQKHLKFSTLPYQTNITRQITDPQQKVCSQTLEQWLLLLIPRISLNKISISFISQYNCIYLISTGL